MRTAVRRDDPVSFLRSMVWVAVGSFVAGFAGYLIFGLTL
jgi:hypothetical protein